MTPHVVIRLADDVASIWHIHMNSFLYPIVNAVSSSACYKSSVYSLPEVKRDRLFHFLFLSPTVL